MSKVLNDRIVGPIIVNNSKCFNFQSDSANDDWEMLALTLGIFYQMTLGQNGYWYPWLRQMLSVDTADFWNGDDI